MTEHPILPHPTVAVTAEAPDAVVAEFGYTQELERGTGRLASFAVAFAFGSRLELRKPVQHREHPSDGYLSFGSLTSVGPWMLGTLLGASIIVGFESAANLAQETKDPAAVVPGAMWQAVLASGILGFLFLWRSPCFLVTRPSWRSRRWTPIADVISGVLASFVGNALLVLVVIAIRAAWSSS